MRRCGWSDPRANWAGCAIHPPQTVVEIRQQRVQIKFSRGIAAIARQLGVGSGDISELPGAPAGVHDQGGGVIQAHAAGVAHDPQGDWPAGRTGAIGHGLPALIVEVAQAFEAAHHLLAVFIRMGVHLGPRGLEGREQH
jgi:hypothetical protein